MSCLAASGSILPGQSVSIPWLFSPLEAKSYSVRRPKYIFAENRLFSFFQVEIPIRITDGATTTITFIGEGYDARILPPAPGDSPSDSIPDEQFVSVRSQVRITAYIKRRRHFIVIGSWPIFRASESTSAPCLCTHR